jgi:hypothetical protein
MTEDTVNDNTTAPTGPHIVSHEFSGDVCKVLVQGTTVAGLSTPEMKKAVYEYRHKIGASHMGLNKFEPTLSGAAFDKDGKRISQGFWYLKAGL